MRELRRYEDVAFSDLPTIERVQEARLREHLLYTSEHSPFYKKSFQQAGIDPRRVTLDRLRELPFTQKSDLENHNDDFLAVPRSKIVDIVLSSGTTGRPTRMMYTERDLLRLAYSEEKSLAGCGIGPDDVVLLTCTMDRCFVAGLAYFLGARSLGAAAIRNGQNNIQSHAELIVTMAPTVIVGVPMFLKELAAVLCERGVDPGETSVSKLVCIGEPVRGRNWEQLKIGRDLEQTWKAKTYSTYASSETVTAFCECSARRGGHLHPDLAIAEIVDEDGKVLPHEAEGEVVVTPLAVEGMPLIRFRTGDISLLAESPCSCGRLSPRLGPILGRKAKMLKMRGTTLYPEAVFAALGQLSGVSDYYVVVTSESDLCDAISVHAAVNEPSCTSALIQNELQARLRVKPEVVIVEEEDVKRQVFGSESRKPSRWIDRR